MELAKTSTPILPSPSPVWLSGNRDLFEHKYGGGGKRKNKKTQKKAYEPEEVKFEGF